MADPAPERDAVVKALARAPHTVKAVSLADLRLEAARDWEPDVIILQLKADSAALPLRIGMLRDPVLANVPLVVLGESEDEARALGAHAFVRSPVQSHLDSLVRVVAHFSSLRLPLPT